MLAAPGASSGRQGPSPPFWRRRHVDCPPRPAAPLHLRRHGDAHRHRGRLLDPRGCPPTSSRRSTSRSSRWSGSTAGFLRRRWSSASPATSSARSPRPSTASSTSRASRSTASRSSRSSSTQARRWRWPTPRSRRSRRRCSSSSRPAPTPPLVVNYSASNVPILQGSVHSDTLSEQELFDLTSNFLRTGLATVQGAQMPFPYGGKQRQVMIDIDLPRLYALGLSPERRDQRHPGPEPDPPLRHGEDGRPGAARPAEQQPRTPSATSPSLPIKTVNGVDRHDRRRRPSARRLRAADEPRPRQRPAGRPHDAPQERRGRPRSTSSAASAASCRSLLSTLPPEYKLDLLFDQSVFVRAAVEGRDEGGGDRRGPHRADDPPLPRELAQHAHRRRHPSRSPSWCRSSASRASGRRSTS